MDYKKVEETFYKIFRDCFPKDKELKDINFITFIKTILRHLSETEQIDKMYPILDYAISLPFFNDKDLFILLLTMDDFKIFDAFYNIQAESLEDDFIDTVVKSKSLNILVGIINNPIKFRQDFSNNNYEKIKEFIALNNPKYNSALSKIIELLAIKLETFELDKVIAVYKGMIVLSILYGNYHILSMLYLFLQRYCRKNYPEFDYKQTIRDDLEFFYLNTLDREELLKVVERIQEDFVLSELVS